MAGDDKKELLSFHNCGDSSSCFRNARVNNDILECIRNIAVNNERTSPTKEDWLVFAEMFPSVVDDAAALIDEGKIKCVCLSPEHGTIYRVYSGSDIYTIFSKYNFCSCSNFQRVSLDGSGTTCEHILACILVNMYKMVKIPTGNQNAFDFLNVPCEYSLNQTGDEKNGI